MKHHLFKILIILFLFFSFLLITSYSYADSIFNNLTSNIFRLHIIANSDSKYDQELKLKIRDNIINYLEPKMTECKNKKQAIDIITQNISNLQKIAINTVKQNGYNYNVTLEIGNFYFPTKYYGDVSMPSRKI